MANIFRGRGKRGTRSEKREKQRTDEWPRWRRWASRGQNPLRKPISKHISARIAIRKGGRGEGKRVRVHDWFNLQRNASPRRR